MNLRGQKGRELDDEVDRHPPTDRSDLIKMDEEKGHPNPVYTETVPGTPITVVVIESQPLMLRALVQEFEDDGHIEVVGTTATGAEGCQLVRDRKPAVLLMAFPLPDMTSPQILRALRGTRTAIIALSSDHSDDMIFRAVVRGANGYILKSSNVDISDAIKRVARGEVVMCGESLTTFVRAVRERATPLMTGVSTGTPLTGREQEVLRLVCDGLSQTKIAERMGLSPATTRTHARNAYKKLGVTNKGAAIREAIRRGILSR